MAVDTEQAQPRAAGGVQLVSQPRSPRRHGPHRRPPLGWPAVPRDRIGLVRARLRRVRLRVRHRGRAGCATSARRCRESRRAWRSSPRRRSGRCRSSSAAVGRRSRCGSSPSTPTRGTRSARPRRTRTRTRCSTSGAREVGRDPARSSARSGSPRTRSTTREAYLDAGASHLIVMTGHPYDLAPGRAAAGTGAGLTPAQYAARPCRMTTQDCSRRSTPGCSATGTPTSPCASGGSGSAKPAGPRPTSRSNGAGGATRAARSARCTRRSAPRGRWRLPVASG